MIVFLITESLRKAKIKMFEILREKLHSEVSPHELIHQCRLNSIDNTSIVIRLEDSRRESMFLDRGGQRI